MIRQRTTPRLVLSAAFLFCLLSLLGCPPQSDSVVTSESGIQSSAGSISGVFQDCGWADDIPDSTKVIPVDAMPEMIYSPPLQYPKMAKTAGLQGVVRVMALICESGQIGRLWVSESSGIASLDAAALAQARECRYKPAMKDGRPIKLWVTYPIEFRLDD